VEKHRQDYDDEDDQSVKSRSPGAFASLWLPILPTQHRRTLAIDGACFLTIETMKEKNLNLEMA
jgi:hypothetical protein